MTGEKIFLLMFLLILLFNTTWWALLALKWIAHKPRGPEHE
ncbi:MAG: hypothetical protein QM426_10465 [Euryarchaeota archaeon]|nr:hypothetical protein [Euryarchaeota archaeon]